MHKSVNLQPYSSQPWTKQQIQLLMKFFFGFLFDIWGCLPDEEAIIFLKVWFESLEIPTGAFFNHLGDCEFRKLCKTLNSAISKYWKQLFAMIIYGTSTFSFPQSGTNNNWNVEVGLDVDSSPRLLNYKISY